MFVREKKDWAMKYIFQINMQDRKAVIRMKKIKSAKLRERNRKQHKIKIHM